MNKYEFLLYERKKLLNLEHRLDWLLIDYNSYIDHINSINRFIHRINCDPTINQNYASCKMNTKINSYYNKLQRLHDIVHNRLSVIKNLELIGVKHNKKIELYDISINYTIYDLELKDYFKQRYSIYYYSTQSNPCTLADLEKYIANNRDKLIQQATKHIDNYISVDSITVTSSKITGLDSLANLESASYINALMDNE